MSVGTLNKALLRFGNCFYPGGCPRTLVWVPVPIDKAAPEELGERGMKPIEFRSVFGRAYGQAWGGRVWETATGDAFFERWRIPFSQPLCPEGVVTFHQQLENQNTQAKGILLRRSDDVGKSFTLQLRRGIFWLGHRAGIGNHPAAILFLHLKGVNVDQGDEGG